MLPASVTEAAAIQAASHGALDTWDELAWDELERELVENATTDTKKKKEPPLSPAEAEASPGPIVMERS